MHRKLMLVALICAVMAATVSVAQAAELITEVAHRNTDSDAPEDPQIAPDLLDEGALCFVDRTHVYSDVPESLIGAEYVILANDNKNKGDYEVDITLSQNATVYVFVDNRMGGAAGGLDGLPNIDGMPWLGDMGFVDTGIDLGIDESADGSINQYFSVFALDVKAGIVTIGGNTEGHGGNMLGAAAMSRTASEAARSPSPVEEATDVLRDLVVSWEPGEGVSAHDVYLGATFDDVNTASRANPMDLLISQGQSGTTLDVGRLEFGQTYYWRVDEVLVADGSIFKGDIWNFTVEPFTYAIAGVIATSNATSDEGAGPERTVDGSGLNESDQHSTESGDMWLAKSDGVEPIWLEYAFDSVYKLHEMQVWNYNVTFEPVLGFGPKDVTVEYSTDGTEWTVLGEAELAQATATADYVANTMVDFGGVAVKFVKITINSNRGGLPQYGLSEVRFLYIPVLPREPQPASDAMDVGVDSVLTWRSGREAATHDVYVSTDPNALSLLDSVAQASYDPGELNLDTIYYWRIDEVNEAEAISMWTGDLWNFTTQEFLVVDDFESYTDDEGGRIYEIWADGWVNDTGATVGYFQAPFAEQTIVNSGSQSMPLSYDNSGVATSEADLELGQNWTTNGIQSLSLYFHGDPANTGQLYLKINNTKVAYEGDAGDITLAAWVPWNVDLSTVGNVSNVSKLTIGIEGAGATGIVYIDDIRLYGRAPEFITPVEPDSPGLLWWAFDEGSGTVATDSSGSGHDGVISGAEWIVPGALGGGSALYFDGTGPIVEDDDAEDYLNGLEAITMAMWVKADAIPTDKGFVIAVPPAGADSFCTMRYDAAGATAGGTAVLKAGVTSTGGEQQLESSNNLQTTEWQHVALTWSSGQPLTLYADGVKNTPTDNNDGMEGAISGCTTLIVGQGGKDDGASWAGLIDDVRIYNRALSAGEILWLAGQTEPVAKPF